MKFEIFENIPVVPYSHLLPRSDRLHVGGPIWHDFENQKCARFFRGGCKVDEQPPFEQINSVFLEPATWIGPYAGHFGHQIYDFSGRILDSLADSKNQSFVVATHSQDKQILPSFVKQIYSWFGLPLEKIKIVSTPTQFKNLRVFPQAEQPMIEVSRNYLEQLKVLTEINLGNQPKKKIGTVYVSRANLHSHFAGERYLEYLMQLNNIKIIVPEQLSLRDQLLTYTQAETLIFAEGSALHALQLLGEVGNVIIINRRRNTRLGLEDFLPNRCKKLSYIDPIFDYLASSNQNGDPALFASLSLINIEMLLSQLLALGIDLRKNFNLEKFNECVLVDIRKWLDVEIRHPRFQNPGSKSRIAQTIEDCLIVKHY